MIAPMSSTIASVSRNSRAADGMRRPSRPSTPTAKAMSVAIGMPQPGAAVAAAGDQQVDPGRHQHAADRGHDGQRRGLGVAQVAVHELVLDLQPDDEEEDHHQGVVDPVLQRLLEPEAAEVDADRGVPERVVRRRPRAVGPDQRRGGGEEQQDRAGGLDAQELAHRPRDQSGQGLVAREVDGPVAQTSSSETSVVSVGVAGGYRWACGTRPFGVAVRTLRALVGRRADQTSRHTSHHPIGPRSAGRLV